MRMLGSAMTGSVPDGAEFEARNWLLKSGYLAAAGKKLGETQFRLGERLMNEKARQTHVSDEVIDRIISECSQPRKPPRKRRRRVSNAGVHNEGSLLDAVDEMNTF